MTASTPAGPPSGVTSGSPPAVPTAPGPAAAGPGTAGPGTAGPGTAGPGTAGPAAAAGQAGDTRERGRAGTGHGQRRDGARRPPDRWKAAFVLLAITGIVAGVAWALLGSRFLVVRSVRVTGLHRVSRAQVLTAAGIKLGLPLVRVDTGAIGRRVEAITQVQSARVTRSWPDAVVISVTERTPALAVRGGGGFDLIDGSGVVVTWAPRRPAGLPLFVPSGAVKGSPAAAAAAGVVRELPASARQRLVSLTAATADDVTLRLTGGVTVVWGSTAGAAAKARVLEVLMRTGAHYYDVSAPTVAATR